MQVKFFEVVHAGLKLREHRILRRIENRFRRFYP